VFVGGWKVMGKIKAIANNYQFVHILVFTFPESFLI